jgi:hypothetical protein
MGSVNYDSWRLLMSSFQRSEGRWTRNNYMKLVEEKERRGFSFWGMGEAKF